jgi:hypothetical protein
LELFAREGTFALPVLLLSAQKRLGGSQQASTSIRKKKPPAGELVVRAVTDGVV